MSNYQKGARFERDLVKKLWDQGWAAVRVAGSGSVKNPVPDVLAVKDGKTLAFECKSTLRDKIYLKDAVAQLREFRDVSGAESYIAVRFYKKKPRFYPLSEKETFSLEDEFLSLEELL